MSELRSLKDLLVEQLQDLYSAENQIVEALPKMEEKAGHNILKTAFSEHRGETRAQIERLERVGNLLDTDLNGETCQAIKGIIKEAEHFMSEDANADVMDAGLVANAQRVEHYEIAGYGSVITYAERLGLEDVAEILKETLEEEKNTDHKLTQLAVETINEEALA